MSVSSVLRRQRKAFNYCYASIIK